MHRRQNVTCSSRFVYRAGIFMIFFFHHQLEGQYAEIYVKIYDQRLSHTQNKNSIPNLKNLAKGNIHFEPMLTKEKYWVKTADLVFAHFYTTQLNLPL